MPISTSQLLHPGLSLATWEVNEPLEELSALSAAFAEPVWNSMADVQQLRERMASRLAVKYLAEKACIPFKGIAKNEHQAPLLIEAQQQISLSHTRGLAAAALSKNAPVGIDVEYKSERVMRIAPKFLNDEEQDAFMNNWRDCLACWCAKEALYKLLGKKGVFFKEQLLVGKLPNGSLHAHIKPHIGAEPLPVHLYQQEFDAHLLVLAYLP